MRAIKLDGILYLQRQAVPDSVTPCFVCGEPVTGVKLKKRICFQCKREKNRVSNRENYWKNNPK